MEPCKQHDTARAITDVLTTNGTAIDLSGATVDLILKGNDADVTIIRAAATLTDAAAGTVRVDVTAAMTANPIQWTVEWEITFADATILTVPSRGYHKWRILADLA